MGGSSTHTTNVNKYQNNNQHTDVVNDNTHTVNNEFNIQHESENLKNGDIILGRSVNLGNSVNKGFRCMGGPGDCPQQLQLQNLQQINTDQASQLQKLNQ